MKSGRDSNYQDEKHVMRTKDPASPVEWSIEPPGSSTGCVVSKGGLVWRWEQRHG
jgi:hypothetical protein